MKECIRHYRWVIADYLSWIACKLRGHTWREMSCQYPGVYGNRAADLKESIWFRALLISPAIPSVHLESIDLDLTELAQLAGENWGHWKPKHNPKGSNDKPIK